MDLMREILRQAEAAPIRRNGINIVPPPEVPKEVLTEHVRLLEESGLVEAVISGVDFFHIKRLTSAGHDFIASAKDQNVWDSAKKKAGGAAMNLFVEVLYKLAAEAILGATKA